MKRTAALCGLALALITALAPAALAADTAWGPHANPAQWFAWGEEEQGSGVKPCLQAGLNGADFATTSYPISVTRSEDGTEIRKIYELSPTDDPAGIPRSDFEQEGFRYTLTDLLKQEAPEQEVRTHTETVSLESGWKDMESVLALLPQEREFTTEDGLTGILSLKLDTVRVEPAGYGSATREVSAARTYPNLAGQDTSYIPKTIQEDGRTLTLQGIQWQTDNSNRGPIQAQRSGLHGERRSKEASGVFVARRKRNLADFATTRTATPWGTASPPWPCTPGRPPAIMSPGTPSRRTIPEP